jgi:glycosyltransferase involved in cell wall biosynthesis
MQNEKTNLPKISILIPTYNRRNFIPFVLRNLLIQEYPHKLLQVVIHDDGEIPLIENYEDFSNAIKPIKLKYLRNKTKLSIGEKRHKLIQNANNNLVVFMDDDDLYEPTYISHSFETLKNNNAGCVGCNKMIFIYPPYTKDDFYALDCGDNKKLIHEATLMFTKNWYNKTQGFLNSNKAEGLGLTQSCKLKTIALTNPLYNMTAVVHGKNTIDKEKFKSDGSKLDPSNISFEEKTTEFIKAIVGYS